MSKHYYISLAIEEEILPEDYLHVESKDELEDILFASLTERYQLNPRSICHFPLNIDADFIKEWESRKGIK